MKRPVIKLKENKIISVKGIKEVIKENAGVKAYDYKGSRHEDFNLIEVDTLLNLIDDLELREMT